MPFCTIVWRDYSFMAQKRKISVSKSTGKILPPKKDPTDTCNSRLSTGKYCQNQAGLGTSHVGTGRCSKHGGRSTGRPKKNVSVSEYLSTDIVKTLEEVSQDDPTTLINLDNEINAVRANLYDFLSNPPKDKDGSAKPFDGAKLGHHINSLIKLIDTKAKLEGKIKTQKVPTQIIVYYVNKVTTILEKHIKDPDLRKRISKEMSNIQLVDESN